MTEENTTTNGTPEPSSRSEKEPESDGSPLLTFGVEYLAPSFLSYILVEFLKGINITSGITAQPWKFMLWCLIWILFFIAMRIAMRVIGAKLISKGGIRKQIIGKYKPVYTLLYFVVVIILYVSFYALDCQTDRINVLCPPEETPTPTTVPTETFTPPPPPTPIPTPIRPVLIDPLTPGETITRQARCGKGTTPSVLPDDASTLDIDRVGPPPNPSLYMYLTGYDRGGWLEVMVVNPGSWLKLKDGQTFDWCAFGVARANVSVEQGQLAALPTLTCNKQSYCQ